MKSMAHKNGMFPLANMREAPWNSNVMSPEEYARLGGDMESGPNAVNPLLIAYEGLVFNDPNIPKNRYLIVDGCHRFRKARERGWTEMRAELDPNIDSEEKARIIGYAKNTERGNQDPYKLADYFTWFSETKKMTHKEISELHGIDRTTVTRVLSLLKIAPEVKTKLADVPYITISHLEPIATAPHHIQRAVIKHINKREHSTVADVARCTRHITEEFERRERLRKAVATAKFPKCPKCGKSPDDFGYEGGDNVKCANFDHWSLSKGLEKEKHTTSGTSEPKIPQSIKSKKPLNDFVQTFRGIVSELLSTLGEIESITLWGKNKAGKKISVSGGFWGDWSTNIEVEVQGGPKFKLNVHKTKIKDSPNIRTRISGPHVESKRDLAKLEQQISEVFENFGVDKQIKTGKVGAASKQKVGRLQNYIIPVTVDGTTFNLWLSANQLRKIRKAKLKARIHIDVEIPEGEREGVGK